MLELDMGNGALSSGRISLKIRRVGQEHCDPKKKHEWRKWDTYDSIHFVLYGSGTLVANGEAHRLSKGDAFLLYANREYEYYPSPNDPWSYVWVDLYSNDTRALFEPCGITPEKPYIRLGDMPAVIGLLKSLYEAYDASDTQQLNCSAYFLLVLAELIKNASSGHRGELSLVKQRHVRDIVTHINNNFRLPLTLQDIASQNHLSVSRMMALFAEVVGMSPIAYLNRFRVSAACDLLRKTEIPIGEIAAAVGVEDRLYFSRMFRRWKGVSPREYRASDTKEDPYAWLKERNIDYR